MKRFTFIIICIVLVFSLVSCGVEENSFLIGLDSYLPSKPFATKEEKMIFSPYMIPNDDYLTDFPYIDGNIIYVGQKRENKFIYKGFLYLVYSDEVYLEAKEYLLETMDLSSESVLCDGCYFYENYAYPKDKGFFENGKNTQYPYCFNMMAYNDDTKVIYFLSLWVGGESKSIGDLLILTLASSWLKHLVPICLTGFREAK